MLSATPQVIENNANYGQPVLTKQSGNHAMDVVDQFLRACPQCVAEGMEQQMYAELQTRLSARSVPEQRNPVILNEVRRDVALDYLKQVPLSALVRGTMAGVLRSTSQTALYETGHQVRWNPRFFSAITGTIIATRLVSFTKTVFADRFLLIWAIAQVATIIALLLQFSGAVGGIRNSALRPYVIFLLAVAAYFLVLNGPFGNAQYGMPLTPVLVVLTTTGLVALLDRFMRRARGGTSAPPHTMEG